MANGSSVLHALEPAPKHLSKHDPAPIKPGEEVESAIGATLAELADVSMQAWQEFREGGKLTAGTRTRGGDLIAELYGQQFTLAQTGIGQTDFGGTVRRTARVRLSQHRGVALSEATVDEISEMLLTIVAKVTATMQAEMN